VTSSSAVVPRLPDEGRNRVVIEGIWPQIDGGRFPVKRVIGDSVTVYADVFADGHDELGVRLRWRRGSGGVDVGWLEVPMEPIGNDRWRATFTTDSVDRYQYAVTGWIDRFSSWERDLRKRLDAGQDVSVDLLIGADLIDAAASRAGAETDQEASERLRARAKDLRSKTDGAQGASGAVDPELSALAARFPDRSLATVSPTYEVTVDRKQAAFSAWYELFPRSASPDATRHGTFRDVIARLPYVAGMGFDVLYLPPIHPIGTTFRKAPNNKVGAASGDPGVPWAIGSEAGGHTAVHPDLGTLADFEALVEAARGHKMEIALDVAFQASPDHPWVREHPEWFRKRPDGTIQYAENPPKKYQDIVPFDFETPAWRELWLALEGVMRFWIDRGVRIFRVDNPHTKAFPFWEWCMDSIKGDHPDVLFLAEAFTRPRPMQRLAKLGFSQSYTYFTWRNSKSELMEYFTELTTSPLSEYFRPNLWPNTPDILHEVLQVGGLPIFAARVVLAATLSGDFGIYGPAFELGENVPIEPGSEEYLNSEKYQQRTWELARTGSLAPLLTALNTARRAHPALQRLQGLRFHSIDNDQLIAYTKQSDDRSDLVLVVVSLDPHREQSGTLDLDFDALALDGSRPLELHDALTDEMRLWHGARQGLTFVPGQRQAVVFGVRQSARTEQQFETYR
jgi:starch synthase (maltosyl-transferring)